MAELAWCNVVKTIRVHRQSFRGFTATAAYDSTRDHPTQKPVALMKWCLTFLPEDLAVIDPYCGTGATGVACRMSGRRFIGIELDPAYVDIARRRIADAVPLWEASA